MTLTGVLFMCRFRIKSILYGILNLSSEEYGIIPGKTGDTLL